LWNTIGLGVQVLAIGLVFGLVFGADLTEFFPFLVVSLVLWNLIVSSISDSNTAYVSAERFIKEIPLPYYFPLIRLLSKNVLNFIHNIAIIVLVMIVFPKEWGWNLLLVLPGFVVLVGNLLWSSTLAALVSSRFRDLPPIITSLLMVSFYVTPIIWMPQSLPVEFRDVVLTYNPFYHLMELVRGPLLGYSPALENWLVGIGLLVIGNGIAWWLARRLWWRVVYWL
jgi:lipopolysaccharide transport system permease protein